MEAVLELERERGAVILARYDQAPEIQELADVIGDSLTLAQAADRSKAELILFLGVHLMAETSKILSLPDLLVVARAIIEGALNGTPSVGVHPQVARHSWAA